MIKGLKKEVKATIEYFNEQARQLNIPNVKAIPITDKLIDSIVDSLLENDYLGEQVDNEIGDTIKSHIAKLGAI